MAKWTKDEIQFLVDNHPKLTTKEMAINLGRDYSSTKRKVKRFVLDLQDGVLPEGFVVIKDSPIHAVNQSGVVIRIRTRRPVRPSFNKKGYLQVCLQNKKSRTIHRIVAMAFVDNPNNKPQVNHIDGNKQNNHASNLEWVTNEENQSHAIKMGLWDGISKKLSIIQKGEGNSAGKLSENDVLAIYSLLKQGEKVGVIARRFGVHSSNISAIKSGKSWNHLYHCYSESSTTRT
jgi:hypothetical protein